MEPELFCETRLTLPERSEGAHSLAGFWRAIRTENRKPNSIIWRRITFKKKITEDDFSSRLKTYFLQDLYSIKQGIDREKFPDRYLAVLERIKRVEGGESPEEVPERGISEGYIDLAYDERKRGIHNRICYPAGVLFGIAFLSSEVLELRYPALSRNIFSSPTLVIAVCGYAYFIFCVYLLHAYLESISNGLYPVSPRKASFSHLIPFYGIYWPKKWSHEVFRILNLKDGKKKSLMKYGILTSVSFLVSKFDAGIAFIIMFLSMSQISKIIVNEYEANNLQILEPKKVRG